MRLAEPEALVHLSPKASVGGAFPGEASQGSVASFLACVADRAAAALEGLGQAYLLEVSGWQLARPGHLRSRNAVGLVMATV
jgi:hypothetical protein